MPTRVDIESLQKSLKEAKENISHLQDASASHDSQLKSHTDELKQSRSHQEKTDKRLENLEKRTENLEKKSESAEKMLEKQEKSLQALSQQTTEIFQTVETHSSTIATHGNDIQSLRKLISGLNTGGGGVPLEVLEDLEAKIKAVDEKHTKISDGLNVRVTNLENALKSCQDQLKSIFQQLEQIKNSINSLEDKIKSKADMAELDRLKNMAGSQGGISEAVLEDIRREIQLLKQKTAEIPQISQNLESLTKRVSLLEDKLKSKIDSSEVHKLLSNLKFPDSGQSKDSNIPYILQKLSEHSEKIEAILKLLNQPASSDAELWLLYKELKNLLDTKASLADLKALEERLQEKVIAVCEAMGNKFADRADTKRALKYLEGFIRDFIEIGAKKPSGEDAMFAKKPLGGWSCASCETNLEKLKGIAAAYYSWNKMPYRDPNDRIARAGPGFSRMLATIQPEAINSRVKTANTKIPSHNEDEFAEPKPTQISKKVVRPMSAYHH